MLTTFRNRNVNPWSLLARDIDEMFNSLPMPSREPWEHDRANLAPAYDIDETDDHYLLSFDIPGVSRDDLSIEVTRNRLVVSGERRAEGKSGSKRYGKFQQSFTLPEGVTADAVQAECRDGVLRLAIQKPATIKPKKIPISDGSHKASDFLKNLIGDKKSKETVDVKHAQHKQQQEPIAMAN